MNREERISLILNIIILTSLAVLLLSADKYFATPCMKINLISNFPFHAFMVFWMFLWIVKAFFSAKSISSRKQKLHFPFDLNGKWNLFYLAVILLLTFSTAIMVLKTGKYHGLLCRFASSGDFPGKTINTTICQNIQKEWERMKKGGNAHAPVMCEATGYIWLAKPGDHVFKIVSNVRAELCLDRNSVIRTSETESITRSSARVFLSRGFHRVDLLCESISSNPRIELVYKSKHMKRAERVRGVTAFWTIPPSGILRLDVRSNYLLSLTKLVWVAACLHFSLCIIYRQPRKYTFCLILSLAAFLIYYYKDILISSFSIQSFPLLWVLVEHVISSEIILAMGVFSLSQFLIGRYAAEKIGSIIDCFKHRIFFYLICACAFLYSLVIFNHVYNGFPVVNGDEHAYQFQAELFSEGRLRERAHPMPEFFQYEFMLYRNGYLSGIYPPGQPLLLTPGVLLGKIELMPALLFALTVFLTGYLAAQRFSWSAGILASLLVFVSPQCAFVFSTRLSHSGSTFFLLLFLGMLLMYIKWNKWIYLGLAGFSVSLAFLCRPATTMAYVLIAGFIFIPVLRKNGKSVLKSCLCLGLGGFGLIIFFLYFNHVLTGNALTMPYQLYNPQSKLGFGEERGIAQEGALVLGEGQRGRFVPSMGLKNTFYNLISFNEFLFGWRFSLFLPMAFFIFGRKIWFDWMMLTSMVCVVLLYSAFWNKGFNFAGPIYYTDIIPLLCIAGAGFIHHITSRWNDSKMIVSLTLAIFVLFIHATSSFIPERWGILKNFTGQQSESLKDVKKITRQDTLVFTPYITEIVDRYPHMAAIHPPDILFVNHLSEKQDKKIMRFYPGRKGIYQCTDGVFRDYLPPESIEKTCFPGEEYGRSDIMWQRSEPGQYMITVRSRSASTSGEDAPFSILVYDYGKNIIARKEQYATESFEDVKFMVALNDVSVIGIQIKNMGTQDIILDRTCISLAPGNR